MTLAEYEERPSNEKEHFFDCSECGRFVDKRELRDVIFHITGHKPKPEIPRIKGKAFLELERVTRKAEKRLPRYPAVAYLYRVRWNTPQFEHETPSRQKRLWRDCSMATAAPGHSLCNYLLLLVHGRIRFKLSVGSCLSCQVLDRKDTFTFSLLSLPSYFTSCIADG